MPLIPIVAAMLVFTVGMSILAEPPRPEPAWYANPSRVELAPRDDPPRGRAPWLEQTR